MRCEMQLSPSCVDGGRGETARHPGGETPEGTVTKGRQVVSKVDRHVIKSYRSTRASEQAHRGAKRRQEATRTRTAWACNAQEVHRRGLDIYDCALYMSRVLGSGGCGNVAATITNPLAHSFVTSSPSPSLNAFAPWPHLPALGPHASSTPHACTSLILGAPVLDPAPDTDTDAVAGSMAGCDLPGAVASLTSCLNAPASRAMESVSATSPPPRWIMARLAGAVTCPLFTAASQPLLADASGSHSSCAYAGDVTISIRRDTARFYDRQRKQH